MRNGDWIETYTGIHFYPLDPRPEEIDITDIAHALSLICRFNGHCKHFYSVAQHSINVYNYLRTNFPTDLELQLTGLLHDASEAYIADVSRPVKPFLNGYHGVERRLMDTIFKAFDLKRGSLVVEEADNLVLHAEAMQLMPGSWWTPNNLDIDVSEKIPGLVAVEYFDIFTSLVRQRREKKAKRCQAWPY
ncbi:hypothetical protein [Anaerospora hongkongensis]|uniref:hypothetical protein n=1 Tax=Anaerospora hongkongensis TaxID=244830 RepID=UPI00289D94F4|nr:hypothetical protein [Anaerospora hongkongensis]